MPSQNTVPRCGIRAPNESIDAIVIAFAFASDARERKGAKSIQSIFVNGFIARPKQYMRSGQRAR